MAAAGAQQVEPRTRGETAPRRNDAASGVATEPGVGFAVVFCGELDSAARRRRDQGATKEASAGGFVDPKQASLERDLDRRYPGMRTECPPGCTKKDTLHAHFSGPAADAIWSAAADLGGSCDHAAPLPLPVAINDQIARSYGQGVVDGMRAGMLNTAELIEREIEDLRRQVGDVTYGADYQQGELAALIRWAARIRASVTL